MMSYDSFKQLSKEEKLTYLTKLRSESSINDILEQWGITRPVYYNIAHEVGLPLKRKGASDKNSGKNGGARRTRKTAVPETVQNPADGRTFSFSIDTSGPVSLVSNILSVISDLDDRQVRVKMDVEVL